MASLVNGLAEMTSVEVINKDGPTECGASLEGVVAESYVRSKGVDVNSEVVAMINSEVMITKEEADEIFNDEDGESLRLLLSQIECPFSLSSSFLYI
jgi:hypothetical protein